MSFDSLIWKIKNLIRQMIPLALIGGILYGGYYHYERGTFRRGLVPGLTQIASTIPVLGTHFKKSRRGSVSKAGKRSKSRSSKSRRGRRRHR